MTELTANFKFIHSDGKEYHFVTMRNELNNMQMYTFNNWHDCIASDKRNVKTIIKNIKERCLIVHNVI